MNRPRRMTTVRRALGLTEPSRYRSRWQSRSTQYGAEALEPRIVLDGSAGVVSAQGETGTDYEESLQITEIMYNPTDPTASEVQAGFTDNEAFEFIEFYNSSDTTTLPLTGVRITEGPSEIYSFGSSNVTSLSPGEYVLVVRDEAAFEERYGSELGDMIAGVYQGSLSNGGERITVLPPTGPPIHSFGYNDKHPWPVAPDGFGYSLNLVDPASNPDHDRASRWTGDGPFGGTPGTANTITQPLIIINELLAHAEPPLNDLIELYNPAGSDVNVGGWFLSDDVDDPTKYVIPAGTTVPANGYLVLANDDDADGSTDPGPDFFGSAFSLSGPRGEELYLFAGDGTNLLGYNESVEFGASTSGVSFGRFPDITGDLFPMETRTFGSPNGEPKFGPVVINEIMYNPPTPQGGGDPDAIEYVEIVNPDSSAVDLTGWEVNGIGYEFPQGQMIGAGDVLVIVRFDPVVNLAARALFEATYGVDVENNLDRYVGPYLGSLDNGGETITLFNVDDPPPEMPLLKPLIISDQADYSDLAPWPIQADGTGKSLTRTADDAFGNSAESWTAEDPTPGSSSSVLLGDMNRDGRIDFDDIPPFVTALSNSTEYQAMYGVPATVHGDIDGDGDLDFDDIPGFVDILRSGGDTASAGAGSESTADLPATSLTAPQVPSDLIGSTPQRADESVAEPREGDSKRESGREAATKLNRDTSLTSRRKAFRQSAVRASRDGVDDSEAHGQAMADETNWVIRV